jgi:FtsH-binding integral membrane protein
VRELPRRQDRLMSPRAKSGFIVGYIALVMGLLFVLSMASEIEPLPAGQAALVVFIHMAVGYVVGWLIQPLLAALVGAVNK